MKKIIKLYKPIISYIFFGICTTLINWLVYFLCYNIIKIPNIPSTIIAWILAVAFAFITNKIWVFGSKTFDRDILIHEICTFTAARLITGLMDVIIMYLTVDLLSMNSNIWKLVSNVAVTILNYIFSKLIILKKKVPTNRKKD